MTEKLNGVAQRLKELRKQKNLSQADLGQLAGLHYTHIGHFGRGTSRPSVDALDITMDFLLTGNPVEDSPPENLCLFRRFKVLEALTTDDHETVIKVIDAMIAKKRMASTLAPVDASA